ncbi:hypothetical protein [Snodgrassella gandavensis]|uniref:hypothetical protein n=1 Tax=Snodgrassella gandavensis TaxID=2946698 RepID=UPI001EF60B63|nr:hypothetical protein [Snodgrassella gandavensis]
MRYFISILRRLISFLMLYLFVCLVQANEQDSVNNSIDNQINVCSASKNNAKIIPLLPVDNDIQYLNGIYYGAVKKIEIII